MSAAIAKFIRRVLVALGYASAVTPPDEIAKPWLIDRDGRVYPAARRVVLKGKE